MRDLKIESYEIITVQRKPHVATARVKLTTKNGELIPEVRAIFQSWFKQFQNEEGFMTAKECGKFIKATTNTVESYIDPSDNRILIFLKEYSIKNYGMLSEEEFIKFYTDKSNTKPETVWNNLTVMKYGGDLKHVSENNNPDDPRELKNFNGLPRAKLSSDQTLFKELIKLLGQLPASSQEELGTLIGQLRTNLVLYSEMLSLTALD